MGEEQRRILPWHEHWGWWLRIVGSAAWSLAVVVLVLMVTRWLDPERLTRHYLAAVVAVALAYAAWPDPATPPA